MSARVLRASLILALVCSACARPDERAIARGNEAAQQGDLAGARAAYAEAARLAPTSAHAWAVLGNAEFSLGHHAAAVEAWQTARAQRPACADAARGLATLALEGRDAGAALAYLDAAPELTQAAPGKVLRARALLARGGPGDAEAALALVEALGATSADAPYLRGNALVALRRYADAQATFEGLVASAPKSPLGPYGLARLAAAQSRSTDTLLYLRQARTLAGPAWSKDRAVADPAFGFLAGSPELADVLGP